MQDEEECEERKEKRKMKKSKLLLVTLLSIAMVLVIAACARGGDETPTTDAGNVSTGGTETPATPPVTPPNEEYVGIEVDILDDLEQDHPLYHLHRVQEQFPLMSRGTGAPIQGGHITHGFPHSDPAPGVFNAVFWISGIDADLMTYIGVAANIFSMMPTMMMGQDGIATYEVDRENQRIIVRQVEDVYWHDGVPLTLDDIVFAHEVIGHADYLVAAGPRFGLNQQRITGMMAYHYGEADYISGLVLSEDKRTLTVYFDEFPPTLLYFGIWGTPYPRHIFGDVPIAEHTEHYHTRVRPIGWGPFMVQNIVPGESIYAVANENFWLGRPHLDSVVTRTVMPGMIPSMMLNGDLDIIAFPLASYPDIPNPTNFMYLGDVANMYNWVAFNLGDWNPETNSLDVHENPRMGDPILRRAMAYASNELLLTDGWFNGLRFPATSFIPPGHSTFLDPTLRGFPYDPDLANRLLDEAGYAFGPDGWRTFPDGSEMVIHFVISGADDPNQLTVGAHYAQAWNDIGLNIYTEWVDWTAKQANIFHADNWDWDVTTAAWGAGANPDPNGLWGDTVNNRARYLNPSLEAHLAGFGSDQAWDIDWLVNHFHEWQHLMVEYIPAFPTNWRLNLVAVNNRVGGFFLGIADDGIRTVGGFHHIYVTADTPYRQ